MKIGFFGSQGTGKTELIKAMTRDPYFNGYEVIESRSRVAANSGGKINTEAGKLDQLVITVARCTADLLTDKPCMSDRTPLDSLAYSMYQQVYVWDDEPGDEMFWRTSIELVSAVMPMYDRLFYFPIYWEPKADGGVRSTDPEYQKEIDFFIRKVASDLKVNYERVPNLSVPGRLGWLKASLEFDSL